VETLASLDSQADLPACFSGLLFFFFAAAFLVGVQFFFFTPVFLLSLRGQSSRPRPDFFSHLLFGLFTKYSADLSLTFYFSLFSGALRGLPASPPHRSFSAEFQLSPRVARATTIKREVVRADVCLWVIPLFFLRAQFLRLCRLIDDIFPLDASVLSWSRDPYRAFRWFPFFLFFGAPYSPFHIGLAFLANLFKVPRSICLVVWSVLVPFLLAPFSSVLHVSFSKS